MKITKFKAIFAHSNSRQMKKYILLLSILFSSVSIFAQAENKNPKFAKYLTITNGQIN